MAQTLSGFAPNNDLSTLEVLLQEIADNTSASNVNELSIIAELELIKAEAIAVNSNTDEIETKIDTVITELQTGNSNLTDVQSTLGDILVEAQAINANTDGLESLITSTNTKLDSLITEQDKELVYTGIAQANNGTDNFYTREVVVYDSETSLEVSRASEYSLDGNTWSTTVPAGTITIGRLLESPTLYNTQEIFDVTTAQTFAADTYHSLAFVIIEGTADVTVDTVTVTNLPNTFSNKYEADTVLSNDITITPATDSRVIVTTIS